MIVSASPISHRLCGSFSLGEWQKTSSLEQKTRISQNVCITGITSNRLLRSARKLYSLENGIFLKDAFSSQNISILLWNGALDPNQDMKFPFLPNFQPNDSRNVYGASILLSLCSFYLLRSCTSKLVSDDFVWMTKAIVYRFKWSILVVRLSNIVTVPQSKGDSR